MLCLKVRYKRLLRRQQLKQSTSQSLKHYQRWPKSMCGSNSRKLFQHSSCFNRTHQIQEKN